MRVRGASPVATVLALVAAASALHAGAAAGPQLPPQGTFRSGVTLVPIDVRVLDSRGNPVSDLTEKDFTILENGVPQTIRHFSLQTFTARAPEPETAPAVRAGSPLELAPQTRRVFLVVFGRGRLQEPSKAVDATLRFLRERLLPQDRVAVIAWNRATDFTTDHERIAAVVERFKRRHEEIEAKLAQRFSGLAAIYGSREIPPAIQEAIDEVFGGDAAAAARELPPAQVSDAARIQDDTRRGADVLQRAEIVAARENPSAADEAAMRDAEMFDLGFEEYVANSAQTLQDLEMVYTGLSYLRHIAGEKHLVFLSEQGLFLPRLEDDEGLAAMASDARVVIDTIQTGGLPAPPVSRSGPPVPGPTLGQRFAVMSLKNIASLTGGQASTYDYADPAFTRIDRVTLSQYLLGYYPTDTTWNGRFRRITVKVNRPGVTVLFRQGYYARQTLVPLDRRAFLRYARVAAAASHAKDIDDIAVQLTASAVTGERGTPAEIFADVKIDIARVSLDDEGGRRVGTVDVSIFCADARDAIVGELWQTIDLALKEETYRRFLRDGLPYTARIPIKAPARHVKIIVYDAAGDRVGSRTVLLK